TPRAGPGRAPSPRRTDWRTAAGPWESPSGLQAPWRNAARPLAARHLERKLQLRPLVHGSVVEPGAMAERLGGEDGGRRPLAHVAVRDDLVGRLHAGVGEDFFELRRG